MSSPLFIKLSASYFWYFSILGLVVPFLPVYLDSKGFSSLQMGEILAIVTVTKIIGPTLWAMLADKSGQQLGIIRLGSLLALLCFGLLLVAEGYWPITFVLAIFSLFWTAILPQIEVLTLKSVRRNPKVYARVRLWGSIGFIILAIITGELMTYYHADVFTFIGMVILLALFISTLRLKQPRTAPLQPSTTAKIIDKVLCARFVLFFISGLLLQVSFGPYYSFFALYLRDLAYPSYAVGLFISVAVVAEILIFIVAGKLFHYFSITKLITCSFILTAIRWWLTGYGGESTVLLVIAQVLHAASFGLYHSASILFVQQHFAEHQQNRGQAIYISGVYGIGGAIGAYLAGLYWLDGAGATHTYNLAAYAALIAAGLSLFISRQKSKG